MKFSSEIEAENSGGCDLYSIGDRLILRNYMKINDHKALQRFFDSNGKLISMERHSDEYFEFPNSLVGLCQKP